MKTTALFILALFSLLPELAFAQEQTEIMKWQYNKKTAICITYDDGTINQFNIAIPLMDERGFPGTFFINTGNIAGSKYQPAFIGRPLEEVLKEAERIPTDRNNIFERMSAIRYLIDIMRLDVYRDFDLTGISNIYEQGNHEEACRLIDNACGKVKGRSFEPVTYSMRNDLTWDQIRQYAGRGHEFACHTISHPYLPVMDKENILYEIDKCTEDILTNLGPDHTFSIECPYGIHDNRVLSYVFPRYQLCRNGLTEEYIGEIMRGAPQHPGTLSNEYVQWQRGPLTDTPITLMKEWVDTSIELELWLVLVFHGVEGIGWEPKTAHELREYFDYIKSHEDNIWVATFQDTGKYIRERMNASVKSSARDNVITVTLTHSLDRNLYTLPLTLRTPVSDSWSEVEIGQGASKTRQSVSRDEKGSFVCYQAVPNSDVITLKKIQ